MWVPVPGRASCSAERWDRGVETIHTPVCPFTPQRPCPLLRFPLQLWARKVASLLPGPRRCWRATLMLAGTTRRGRRRRRRRRARPGTPSRPRRCWKVGHVLVGGGLFVLPGRCWWSCLCFLVVVGGLVRASWSLHRRRFVFLIVPINLSVFKGFILRVDEFP